MTSRKTVNNTKETATKKTATKKKSVLKDKDKSKGKDKGKGKGKLLNDIEFEPNLTPQEVLQKGSFGGTYWRPIKYKNKIYKDQHLKYKFGLDDSVLTLEWDKYDKKINKYGVKVGQTFEEWLEKDWISDHDPYGWFQWYCNYHSGRRCSDDERQMKRWASLAGKNGRFKKWLVTLIIKKEGNWNDVSISPKIRQTLLHWGYELTKKDFDDEVKSRKSK
jgi:hypothetical protein